MGAKQRRLETELWIRSLIDKLIDKVDAEQTIAIVGLTIVIRQGIDWTEYKSKVLEAQPLRAFAPAFGLLGIGLESLWKSNVQVDQETITENIQEWILSFSIAYLIVKNFGELVKAGANVLSMAKNLLGLVTA